MSNLKDCNELHLLAHGTPGHLDLGTGIDTKALYDNAEYLSSLNVQKIILWGCHVGKDIEFIKIFSNLTNAKVYASKDYLGKNKGMSDEFPSMNEFIKSLPFKLKLIIRVEEDTDNDEINFSWNGIIGNCGGWAFGPSVWTMNADYMEPVNLSTGGGVLYVADRKRSDVVGDTGAGNWIPLTEYHGLSTEFGSGAGFSDFEVNGMGIPWGVHPLPDSGPGGTGLMVGGANQEDDDSVDQPNLATHIFTGSFTITGSFSTRGLFDSDASDISAGEDSLWTSNFGPGEIVFALASAICFLEGTPVLTDQGEIPIEQITSENTIDEQKVVKLIKVMNKDNYMILVKKNALSQNVPSQDTYIGKNHGIYIDDKLVYANSLLLLKKSGFEKVETGHTYIYNVLLPTHSKMSVNNMIVETLDPSNLVI